MKIGQKVRFINYENQLNSKLVGIEGMVKEYISGRDQFRIDIGKRISYLGPLIDISINYLEPIETLPLTIKSLKDFKNA